MARIRERHDWSHSDETNYQHDYRYGLFYLELVTSRNSNNYLFEFR